MFMVANVFTIVNISDVPYRCTYRNGMFFSYETGLEWSRQGSERHAMERENQRRPTQLDMHAARRIETGKGRNGDA